MISDVNMTANRGLNKAASALFMDEEVMIIHNSGADDRKIEMASRVARESEIT